MCHHHLSQFPIIGDAQRIKKCDLRYTGYAQLDENGESVYYTEYKNEQDGSFQSLNQGWMHQASQPCIQHQQGQVEQQTRVTRRAYVVL